MERVHLAARHTLVHGASRPILDEPRSPEAVAWAVVRDQALEDLGRNPVDRPDQIGEGSVKGIPHLIDLAHACLLRHHRVGAYDTAMSSLELPLAGHVAIVTGAAGRGIGRATALALAQAGADIAINTHRSVDAAATVAAQVADLGRRAIVVEGDVGDPAVVDAIVEATTVALGAPDVVIASAGGHWIPRPIETIPPDEWREAMAEEVDALYLLVRATLPAMRAAGWGRVVTVGGYDADQWTVPPEVGPIDYALGKAARHWLVRTLARQEAAHGVTFNAVAPGPVTRIALDDLPAALAGTHDLAAYRRPTQVDVANAIVRLCLDGNVTGSIVALPGPEPGAVSAG